MCLWTVPGGQHLMTDQNAIGCHGASLSFGCVVDGQCLDFWGRGDLSNHSLDWENQSHSQPLQSMDWFILVYIREHWQEAMFFPMKHGSCSWCSLLFSDIDHPEDVPGCDGLKRKPLIFPLPKDKDLRILLSTLNFPPIYIYSYIYNSIYSNSIWVIKPKQTQLHLTICPIHKLPFGIFAGLTQISFFLKKHFRSLGFF